MSMPKNAKREQILKDAWIGDAVLCLYARLKILREDNVTDGPKEMRMTSNQFLSGWAEPSETEAEIGKIYENEGLEAAFQWIEARLMPMFERQETKRLTKAGRLAVARVKND
jgi:dsRNA-specific ribonuclease